MSANLARAQLLLAQSRPADAEQEALLALAAQPENTAALAVLALSRSAQEKGAAALTAAETAVGLQPDDPYLHYIRAITLHRMDRHDAARSAVNESLRLNPENEECFALLSAIELGRGKWAEALNAAEQALVLNPEHVEATNFRAMALVRLGRKGEATEAVDFALHRSPESALSHANQGWNYLHRNEPRRAQDFFREALRLGTRDGVRAAGHARSFARAQSGLSRHARVLPVDGPPGREVSMGVCDRHVSVFPVPGYADEIRRQLRGDHAAGGRFLRVHLPLLDGATDVQPVALLRPLRAACVVP